MDSEGGGIYADDTTLTLLNTNVKGNKATTAYNDIFNGPLSSRPKCGPGFPAALGMTAESFSRCPELR